MKTKLLTLTLLLLTPTIIYVANTSLTSTNVLTNATGVITLNRNGAFGTAQAGEFIVIEYVK